jgi:hypothetical protein
VAAFAEAHRAATEHGAPNSVVTYSLVSRWPSPPPHNDYTHNSCRLCSLWTSAFALGAFVGPTVAGL